MLLAYLRSLQQRDQIGLDVKTIRKQPQETRELRWRVKKVGPQTLGQVATYYLEELFD